MDIVYSRELADWLSGRKKKNISVEVASSNTSDIEVTEIYLRLVDDDFAAYLTGKKRYRSVPAEVGQVLLPPYRLHYDDTVSFDLEKYWVFHRVKFRGIRL